MSPAALSSHFAPLLEIGDPMTTLTRDSWKDVLRSAVHILRALEKRGFPRPDFTMGGGTVLMFRFEHRLSRDIDLFLSDVQFISVVSPRLNDYAASVVSDYVEQANAVKLIFAHGDVDFLAAGPVIPDDKSDDFLEFEGEHIRLESTAEILGKKMLYRAESLKSRDAFDLAAAMEYDRPAAARAVRAAASKAAILDRRLDELARLPADALESEILVLERGRHLLADMITRTRRFIADEIA